MLDYLLTLPQFLAWWLLALVECGVFVGLYILITPHSEFRLIREGNVSAAVMLSGALLGFVLPVASALAHSVNLADFAVWGVVALVVQLIVYLALRLSFRPLHELIEQDRLSVAILCAAIGVGAGVLNAAAMTY
ncbi:MULTISPECIES: DUF350 domain-containing protein [Hydrocarboniphaga]|uniref:DUF350 domain-containing protein n=1 Tax=Hydrocarboniphaga effusa AP103 TaxID=1172194 RepID=I7ZAJ3_9GAMM|nr:MULTISPECIES: DUF350 domain-containing protein [Hydrocarboniphaga]EIT68687.1 hypothetical protein WQQ_38820 [Hydrocarboniphaga effusa AP103]MDZ4076796.1 DUF350 domain-containing protein [Hydrocarboniphaga sp.]